MNTNATEAWRLKYYSTRLQQVLRNALIAEAICQVDRSDSFYIRNPYSNTPTAAVHTIDGSYAVTAYSTVNDTLTIADEVTYGEHVYDFENVLNNYDLWADRVDTLSYSVAYAIDKWVINEMADNGTGAYSTPAGGFTTMANINVIMSNLLSKVAGYATNYQDLFLVIENTDLVGFVQAQAANGFSFADATLKNGWMANYMGVDVYVVRSGTFVDETTSTVSGSKTWLNDGLRIFGVKGVATYAAPRGINVEEKGVTLKTGKELAVFGYIGFKLWTQNAGLVVRITIV